MQQDEVMARVVRQVVERYVRNRAPIARNDLVQAAWCTALAALRTHRPARGPLENYLRRATAFGVRDEVSRMLAVAKVPGRKGADYKGGAAQARLHAYRVPVEDAGGALVDRRTPEDEAARRRWAERVRAELTRLVEALPQADRGAAADAVAGKDPCDSREPNRARAYSARNRLREAARRSTAIARLWMDRPETA